MSTGPTNGNQNETQTQAATATIQQAEAPSLLDQVVYATVKAKVQTINRVLSARTEEIERLLPSFMKGQSLRLIARAMQYFARGDWRLQQCTDASFVKCIMEAAELGFAIDGKMVHAVGRTKKKKENGQWYEWIEASIIVDYKAIIAVAKRCKTIQDAWARPVFETEEFSYVEENGKVNYRHVPDFKRERDSLDGCIGILAVATHHDGWYRTDFMPLADVNKIRNSSPGYKSDDANVPWNKHYSEMAKKTAIKRLLKTFSDDPGLIRIMEIDDSDYTDDDRLPHPESASEGGEGSGSATSANSPSSTPLSRTQALAESLRTQVSGTVTTAAEIVKPPEQTSEQKPGAPKEEKPKSTKGKAAKPTEITSTTPTTPPAKEIPWSKRTPEQKTEYTLSEIAKTVTHYKDSPTPEAGLERLTKIAKTATEEMLGKDGYRDAMHAITEAERILNGSPEANDAPPFGSENGELTEADEAALSYLRGRVAEINDMAELAELERRWTEEKPNLSEAGFAAGVKIFAEAKGPIE